MFRSIRTLVACAAVALCAACATAPSTDIVSDITAACAADAAVRPIVTQLEVLATPAETQALTLARGVIDPICANPAAAPSANALQIVMTQGGVILGVVETLRARQKVASVPGS